LLLVKTYIASSAIEGSGVSAAEPVWFSLARIAASAVAHRGANVSGTLCAIPTLSHAAPAVSVSR
jgi:hypothetical protein